MEARSERKDGVVILSVSGRLDAFGARTLELCVRDALSDDDRDLVIDIGGSSYLSSGGIRVFSALKKEMKRRNGRFALASVGEYPKKVLDMAGFTSVLDIFPDAGAAVSEITHTRKNPSRSGGLFSEKIIADGIPLTIEQGRVVTPAVLRVIGNLDNVLYSRITEPDVKQKKFSEVPYSLGLGELGADVHDAMPLLGEMITLHGSMVWLPTDGNNTPDFLTPADAAGDVPVYTGYNIALEGQFAEYCTLESEDPRGTSISAIYRAIFSSAPDRVRGYTGLVALVIWGVIAGFASSGIKKAPVATAAPPGGESIMAPSHVRDWLASDAGKSYTGDTLVSFGIGIDLTTGPSHFYPETLSALYYANPLNTGAAPEMYLHNHGVVFRNIPYDASLDLNAQVKKITTDGEFVDMRHLLDSTRLRKAKIGVAYIQDILRDG
jgi:anti-anti-sigma factor